MQNDSEFFNAIVMKRYATKSFDRNVVPEEKLAQLQEIIRYAASSYNLQPWKIVIVSDKATKELLAPAAFHQPQITSCSHLLVFCADTDLAANIVKLEKVTNSKSYADMLRDFDSKFTPERRLHWAQRQVYLALGNAINGAKALGFDSCPMEGFDPMQFAKLLDLPSHIVPTALCPIGFANDTPRPKLRLSKEDIFI